LISPLLLFAKLISYTPNGLFVFRQAPGIFPIDFLGFSVGFVQPGGYFTWYLNLRGIFVYGCPIQILLILWFISLVFKNPIFAFCSFFGLSACSFRSHISGFQEFSPWLSQRRTHFLLFTLALHFVLFPLHSGLCFSTSPECSILVSACSQILLKLGTRSHVLKRFA